MSFCETGLLSRANENVQNQFRKLVDTKFFHVCVKSEIITVNVLALSRSSSLTVESASFISVTSDASNRKLINLVLTMVLIFFT